MLKAWDKKYSHANTKEDDSNGKTKTYYGW